MHRQLLSALCGLATALASAALAVRAVAGIAVEIDEEFFPSLGGTLGRVLREHCARAQGSDDGNGDAHCRSL